MWRWMLRTSGLFVFVSLFLTASASAHPKVYVQFGVPGVYPSYGYPGYVYPGYAYPYAYSGYNNPYLYGYSGYTYPQYLYPGYGYGRYAWRDGYRGSHHWRGGRYVGPYGRGYRGWYGREGHWHR